MILGICNAPEVLEVMRIVKIVIQIIKIAVPIILIVYGMITYIRAIIDSDNDNLTKANKTIINMFIAAVAIFLVPTLVGTIFDIAAVSDNGVVDCFHNADKEGIINGYIERIESNFSKIDYNKAKKYVDNLDEDDPIKAIYQKKISSYKEYVDIVSDIESLTSNNFSEKANNIKNRISRYIKSSTTRNNSNIIQNINNRSIIQMLNFTIHINPYSTTTTTIIQSIDTTS